MNLVGDDFFANAGFAHDQQRRIDSRDSRRHFDHPLHRWAFRHQVFHFQLLQTNLLQLGNIALIQFHCGFKLALQSFEVGHVAHVDHNLHKLTVVVKHRRTCRHDLIAFARTFQNIHQQRDCLSLLQCSHCRRFIVPLAVDQFMGRFAEDLSPGKPADFFPGRIHAGYPTLVVSNVETVIGILKNRIQFLDHRIR